jgi:hypothetical protein
MPVIFFLAAGDEVADAARVAHEAVAAVPADARRDRPAATAAPCADLVDDRGDLVSRHARQREAGELPALDEHVAVTDAARADAEPYPAWFGLGDSRA